jgi:RNA polymerase sigma-B factor
MAIHPRVVTDGVDELHSRYADSPTPELETVLLQRYQGLAGQLASRFKQRGASADDLRQVALLALVRALRRFDPGRGAQFSTYAEPSILGELKRYFRDHGWLVRPPRTVQENYLAVFDAVGFLEGHLGRAPTVDEVADYAAVPETAVLESFRAAGGRRGSLHDDTTFEQGLGDDGMAMLAAENSVLVDQLIGRLSEDQRRVVLLSYFTDLPQREIAARLGLSELTVSRLRRRALDLMRATARTAAAVA